jgi:predicted membrane-bound mannosyltransferase
LAAFYYWRRRDEFGRFLVYWSVANFTLYAVASERMPWLLVNMALPLVVLSGKLLDDLARDIDWKRLVRQGGLLLLPGVPLFVVLAWWLAFYEGQSGVGELLVPMATTLVLVGLAALGIYMARRLGTANLLAFSAFPLAALLLVLTVRAGVMAAYQHGDTPVEMIVYTQTSPDITRVRDRIERAGELDANSGAAPVSVDPTSGFSWPWAWYLRDYTDASYEKYVDGQDNPPLVVLLHDSNRVDLNPVLAEAYTEGERIRHRWWFPENTYRDLTLGKFFRAFGNRDAWRSAMDYFLHRKGVDDRLGSEDAYVYYSLELPE